MKFELNPQCEPSVTHLGQELEPVLVIDNALRNYSAYIEDAALRSFSPIGPYYPGIRSALGDDFGQSLAGALRPWLSSVFGDNSRNWRGEYFYSLVTTPPKKLAPIQRLPHYDGVERERLAVVLFLNAGEQGGTSFFRHRQSGFETVSKDRFVVFKQMLETEVRRQGIPKAAYVDAENTYFETIETFAPKQNRMLVYRGVNLHCSAIDNSRALSTDVRKGRLTINAFMLPESEKKS